MMVEAVFSEAFQARGGSLVKARGFFWISLGASVNVELQRYSVRGAEKAQEGISLIVTRSSS